MSEPVDYVKVALDGIDKVFESLEIQTPQKLAFLRIAEFEIMRPNTVSLNLTIVDLISVYENVGMVAFFAAIEIYRFGLLMDMEDAANAAEEEDPC